MSSDVALRAAPRDRLLGELLLEAGLLGEADLERGLALQEKIGGRLGSVLMRIGAVSEDNLLQVLGRQLGLPLMGSDVPLPDEDMLRLTAGQAATGIDWLLDQQVLVCRGKAMTCCARRVTPCCRPCARPCSTLTRAAKCIGACAGRRIWSACWMGWHTVRVPMIFLVAAMSSNCVPWPKKRRWCCLLYTSRCV